VRAIEELLDGKGVDYPPDRQVNKTFKKAQGAKESTTKFQSLLL
jgi:hypothetical protein